MDLQAYYPPSPGFTKFLRVMKICAFILLAGCLQISAKSVSQTVTLSEKNAPLEEVFAKIKQQTGYVFFYSYDALQEAKKISIDIKNVDLRDALTLCLKNQPLSFTIENKTVFIVKKTAVLQPAATTKDALSTFFPPPPIDVRGKVVNENGEPVAGASVKVKGTNVGTTTDVNGEFVLKGIDDKATLVFSGTNIEGFETKVNGRSELAINLKTKVSKLDEVQIIAYGQTTQRLSTGNISTVKAKDIEKQPVNNPLLALQGRVPGLFITQNYGLPGGALRVQVQGQNSILNGNDPLYVIDGVPNATILPDVSNIIGGGNLLSYLNPNDIESIDILKGADATAIYGSRAANGAILITTKKGKKGTVRFSTNLQTGWGKVSRFMDLMNTQQYLEMRREAFKNDGILPTVTTAPDLLLWDTTRYTDWQKELIGGTAKWHDIYASISGGNSNTQFLVSGNYHKETTVFPGDFADSKGSLHFNLNNVSSNQRFRISLTGSYQSANNRLPASQDLTSIAMGLAPNAPHLKNNDGSLNWAPINPGAVGTWTNPLSYLYQKYKNNTQNLVSSLQLGFRIVNNLDLKVDLGYSSINTTSFSGTPILRFDPARWGLATRTAQYAENKIISWIAEPQLHYKKSIGKSNFNSLIGITIQQTLSNGQVLNGSGYNNDLVLEDIKSAPSITVGSTVRSQYKYNAAFGRLGYNWNEKYLVNISLRRDGSSRFGSESQFHNFWAVGSGWILSKEKFINKLLPFISFAKLRSSYGTTGNDQIGDYGFLNLYSSTNVGIPYQGQNGLQINGLFNPVLQWEETKKLEGGIELGFFKDKFLLNANYFRNRSSNQLINYALPSITGVSSIRKNLNATVQNSGWEFSLSSNILRNGSFNWNSAINFTLYRNKLISFPELETSSYASQYVIGKSLNLIKLLQFAGVEPLLGRYEFVDSKGQITTTPNLNIDRTILLDLNPEFYGGFHNTFSYKGFEIDFLFQFIKQKGSDYKFGRSLGPGFSTNNQPVSVLERWQRPGDIVTIQRFTTSLSIFSQYTNATLSNLAYTDASFIRLKNLSISWNLDPRLVDRVGLATVKFFVHGQNLLTISNYKGGLDPETRNVSFLPPLRILTVGINTTF